MAELDTLISSLENGIIAVFAQCKMKSINVKKRNKKLKQGDFVVSLYMDKCDSGLKPTIDPAQIKAKLSQDCEIRCITSKFENDRLFLSLERKQVMQVLAKEVYTKGQHYGHQDKQEGLMLLASPLLLHDHPEELTLESLRSILTSLYAYQLLCASNYRVCCPMLNKKLQKDFGSLWKSLLSELNTLCGAEILVTEDVHTVKEEFLQKLSNSDYALQPNVSHGRTKNVKIDSKKFITDKLPHRKFSKNIETVNYHEDSVTVGDIVSLELYRRRKFSGTGQVVCVHIVPKSMEYQHQLVDLGWNLFSYESPVQQKSLVCNSVSTQKVAGESRLPSVKDLIQKRSVQMKEAFESKYGLDEANSGYSSHIEQLTTAALKFDFLLSSHSSLLKLDVSKSNTKGGVFVMYNYARLSTLFSRFETSVSEGTYPVLPDHTHIDWSLLKEEEEWEMFFNFILVYPSVIKQAALSFVSENPRLPMQTHTLCQFLQDLSLNLSSYYNRVHVLTESYPHLLPTMYARIHLLKLVHQIMYNGLRILQIEPLEML